MNLNEFGHETSRDLARFLDHWASKHAEDPAGYPWDLEPGDWNEQFLLFLSLESGE